jgi:hypothetical protein
MKTSNNISTLADVRRRKIELKREMAEQRGEILDLVNVISDDFTPRNLLKKVAGEMFGSVGENQSIISHGIARNVGNLSSFLVKDSRKAQVVRILAPVVIAALPQIISWVGSHLPNTGDIKNGYQSVVKRIQSIF